MIIKDFPYNIQIRLPAGIVGGYYADPVFFGWMKENIGQPYEQWMTAPVMLETIDDKDTLLVDVHFRESSDAVLTALRWA